MRVYRRYRQIVGAALVVWLAAAALSPFPSRAQDSAAQRTYAILEGTDIPARDRLSLAVRLLGIPPEALSRVLPPKPRYTIGERTEFTAVNLDTARRFTVKAELIYLTPHTAIWLEDGVSVDRKKFKASADHFETTIYPRLHALFGTEDIPGIDNDPRLHILHAHHLGSGVGAYYDPDSEFPRLVQPGSNERQMFFVNLDTMGEFLGGEIYEGVLAHEFQHMIHHHADLNESSWLDEGLAELASALAGYDQASYSAAAFLSAPNDSLNDWQGSNIDYGAGFLFTAYFHSRFGDTPLRHLVENPLNGLAGVRDVLSLQRGGELLTLEEFFGDWAASLIVKDYAPIYTNLPFKLPPTNAPRLAVGVDQPLPILPFAPLLQRVDVPARYEFTFSGSATLPLLPITIPAGRTFWWSNRADESEATLTRRFDLRGVTSATLVFGQGYMIEQGWDYAYVQASTDGGVTWKALPGTRTEPRSDNNPYGDAYNGEGVWATERVDLSAYAGGEVLIRFVYLTDAGTLWEGMVIDNIAVPEIGYFTDAETDDGGWLAEGWVRVENVLPTNYLIQAITIRRDGTTQVDKVVNGGVEGRYTFTVGDAVEKVVFVFSNVTEYTTLPAEGRYTLRRVVD